MTDSCQTFSMSRLYETLSSRVILDPTLRSLRSLSMGLLRFSIFDAVEKSVNNSIRANWILVGSINSLQIYGYSILLIDYQHRKTRKTLLFFVSFVFLDVDFFFETSSPTPAKGHFSTLVIPLHIFYLPSILFLFTPGQTHQISSKEKR